MIPLVLCDKCRKPMSAVRPGKWQCDCEAAGMPSDDDEQYAALDHVLHQVDKRKDELGLDVMAKAYAEYRKLLNVRAECQAEMERKQREWVTAGINWMGKLHQTGWNDWDVDQAILSQTWKGEAK